MDRSAMVDALVDTILTSRAHPLGMAGVLMDGERAKGAVVLPVGTQKPVAIPANDWTDRSVFSLLNGELRIVAVVARHIGSGALHRLVHGTIAAGLVPVVIEPVGLTMPAILAHWGWRQSFVGEGFERVEEWRPVMEGRS